MGITVNLSSALDKERFLEIAYVGVAGAKLKWEGVQVLYFDAEGSILARLAGGGRPMYPNVRWLRFVRSPKWQLALQVPSEGRWRNVLWVRGTNCGVCLTKPFSRHDGAAFGEARLTVGGIVVLDGEREISRVVSHIPPKYEVFSGDQLMFTAKTLERDGRTFSQPGVAWYLKLEQAIQIQHAIDARTLVSLTLTRHDVDGRDDILEEATQEEPSQRLQSICS